MKVAVIWLLIIVILLNIPTILLTFTKLYFYKNCKYGNLEVQSSACLANFRLNEALWITIEVMHSIIGSFIPLIILIILNILIASALCTLTKKRRHMSLQAIKERNLTKTLVMVVGSFGVCQIPANVVYLVYIARWGVADEVLGCALGISNALVVLNSPMNFVIYCLFSKRFKHLFNDMLPCHRLSRTNIALAV